eukprot:TRINITY_DN2511_c1_g2_i2.p1 TRINITY_DN2511_c1_g2~~TRINITY_DN2511_c1_g2_i2.p1  ORF type:complete len:333 (-),score=56.42 TRINITY_DN2511_c1_g2_i2:311-1309(-)
MSGKRIGTHDGTFHADEALACFMLLRTNEFKDSEIVRTRKKEILDTLDVIVDVGAVYDPERHRYDHHQAGFTGTFDDKHDIKLSSAGLVYKHFGRQIISNRLHTSAEHTELIYQLVYDHLIEGIDGIDNGVHQYPTDIKPKYSIGTDLSSRVGRLNPGWNEPVPIKVDDRFKRAMEMAGEEFLDKVDYYGKSWLPAREYVERAISSRFEVDPSGEIITLERICPWKSHLYEIEKEQSITPPIKYCLFADNSGAEPSWRVGCVGLREDSFELRLPLAKPWRGLRDEELSKESQIPGCIFVHINGFIGGNKTKEGALMMAQKSLKLAKEENSTV